MDTKHAVETEAIVTVLLADPLRIVREGLAALLAERREVKVIGQAGAFEELIEQAENLRPRVVVVEGFLPDREGPEVVRRLRAAWPAGAILLLSGERQEERVLAVLEAGADGYLHKDCRPGELVRAILTLSRGELFLPASVGKALLARLSGGGPQNPRGFPPSELTGREGEILALLMDGLSNKEIAQRLYISVRTVEMHLSNIYAKLGVSSRLEAATFISRARRA